MTDSQQTRPSVSKEVHGDQGADHRRADRLIVLDGDLPPDTVVSGVVGLDDLSTINRAIASQIDQGHHPNHAYATLSQYAAAAGVAIHVYAARLRRLDGHCSGPGVARLDKLLHVNVDNV